MNMPIRFKEFRHLSDSQFSKTSLRKKNGNQRGGIPYPYLSAWSFKRIEIPDKFILDKERIEASLERYKDMNKIFLRLYKTNLFKRLKEHPRFLFLLFVLVFRSYFKLINRLEVSGRENIPKKGAIFYANHPGSMDVLILVASAGIPISCFIAWDNFFLTRLGEKILGFINKHRIRFAKNIKLSNNHKDGLKFGDVLIEKMIRTILLKNRYFAIWPEGGLEENGKVMQGFSGIVKVYKCLNAKRDIIPFVPVLINGSECYHIDKNPKLKPVFQKIKIQFLKPVFIKRDWLKLPNEGGKTPRQIIDYLMKILAEKNHQKKLYTNPYLNARKRHYIKKSSQ
ncbi:MAG: lysophospholipid acyltransferase family protein [Promethearchaeota archaeon]